MDSAPTTTTSVLITGGATAAGRELTRQLVAAGHRVTGTVSSPAQASLLRQDGGLPAYPNLLRAGELRSVLVGAQATVVVHLATQQPNQMPQLNRRWDDYLPLLEQGTAALVTAAAEAGVEYLVFASYAFLEGDAAHGDGGEDEAIPLLDAARRAEDVALHAPVPACVLRAGYVYGALSPEFIALRDELKLHRPVALGNGHSAANWIHAADLARAIVFAIEQRPAGAILPVVDDKPAPVAEFTRYFADSMKMLTPGGMSWLARMRMNKTQLALLERSAHASNADAKAALGWTPQYPTYREGIEQAMLILRAEEPVR